MQHLLQSSINRTKIHQYNIAIKYIFKRKKNAKIKLSENSPLSQKFFFLRNFEVKKFAYILKIG